MSNVEDSSSLEYLDESQYLEEDDHYTQFLLPPVPPQRHQSKSMIHPLPSIMPSGSSSSLRPRPKEPIMTQSSSLYSPVLERAGSFAAMDGFRKTTLEAPSSTSIQSASLQRSPSSVIFFSYLIKCV